MPSLGTAVREVPSQNKRKLELRVDVDDNLEESIGNI